jgi:hypothetical protein
MFTSYYGCTTVAVQAVQANKKLLILKKDEKLQQV